MKCSICKSSKSYIKNHKHTYTIKNKKITFPSKRSFCSECNNLVYDSELDNKASEIAISLYNQKYGINKEQILELRNQYNLSQELFLK